jgi:hypothetical protein
VWTTKIDPRALLATCNYVGNRFGKMTLGIARGSKKSKSKTRVPSSFSFVYNSSIHCQSRRERSSVDKSHEHCILPRGCPRSHTPPSVRYLTRALEQEGRVNPPIQQKAHAENHVFFGFLIGRWIDPIQLIFKSEEAKKLTRIDSIVRWLFQYGSQLVYH